jgi:hypothetical protein
VTVTLHHAEAVIDLVVAKLQAGLAARLATINATDTQGITITTPDQHDYYVGGVNDLARCPALIVTVGETLWAGEGAHSLIGDHEIIVFCIDEDTDRERLTRKLWRMSRAVTEVLWDDTPQEALSTTAYMIRPDREEPGPTEQPDEHTANWRSGRAVVFTASQSEN